VYIIAGMVLSVSPGNPKVKKFIECFESFSQDNIVQVKEEIDHLRR
jgi:hypothetical protein